MNKPVKFIKSSGNLFKDFGFDEAESRELQFRLKLIVTLVKYIQTEGMTQQEAGELFGVHQSRISKLMSGQVDLFSASMLLSMLDKAGFNIYHDIENLLQDAA